MTRANRRYIRAVRAFTLIEVLIAVFVLALGLLGIGAVFPVVVRQQRMAQDAVQGVTAARNAIAYLESSKVLNEPSLQNSRKGWDTWLRSTTWAPIGSKPQRGKGWRAWPLLDVIAEPTSADFGAMLVRANGSPEVITIPLSDRLWPQPFTGETQPQFIWDFVGRRIDTTSDGGGPLGQNNVADDQLEIVVFVRRIDPGIKVSSAVRAKDRMTLSNRLTGSGIPRRSPLGEDADGRPTFDGTNSAGSISYSRPIVIDVLSSPRNGANVEDGYRLELDLSRGTDFVRYASIPGQKLVDNFGTVHTVSRADDKNPATVILERPVSADLLRRLRTTDPMNRVQIVFTPQVPVSVAVRRIQR